MLILEQKRLLNRALHKHMIDRITTKKSPSEGNFQMVTQTLPDMEVRKEIQDLKVFYPNADYNYHQEEEGWNDREDDQDWDRQRARNYDRESNHNNERDYNKDYDRGKPYDQYKNKVSKREDTMKEAKPRQPEQGNYRFNEAQRDKEVEEDYNYNSTGRDKGRAEHADNYRFRKTDQKKDYDYQPKNNREDGSYVRRDREEEERQKYSHNRDGEKRDGRSGNSSGRGGWNPSFNNYGFIERKNFPKDKEGRPMAPKAREKFYVLVNKDDEDNKEISGQRTKGNPDSKKEESAENISSPEQKTD